MPYCLKITRNTKTQEIKIHPVTPCPFALEPGKRYPSRSQVETVQIFETREEAESAHAAEIIAARFAALDRETLWETFRADLDRVANFGWTITELCRQGNMNRMTMGSYAVRIIEPNPRIAAKVHMIADALENVAKFAGRLLPRKGDIGSAHDTRGGRKPRNPFP